ncbi:hypothetical protein L228DRAFT_268303 [Xylona heveae TC161]|uniref:Uncharacterized protein n=1 Tax=Xylona heveae (strain CBS 132557 / TC161) TaxID=1328760 RepID=A0A165H3I4_XYLHT|nr:hypothetical protein L228DRAFT_268303 [Xylona heveae TC161]KZF22933.1 hypothetical protein L228DRAFT_268303 [Xylona heveae TC161]
MSYYEPQGWQAPVRQTSWDQPAPPSRSGASSAVQRDDNTAFSSQLDEVDRAVDNLMKSGKMFNAVPRRDSMPVSGAPRPFEYDPRLGGSAPQRPHSLDFEQMRPQSATNLQNFYANQRFQPRPNEAEQMMQAKRRMAAQRERELRNYHQEQQYNRKVTTQGGKVDRSMSPSAMSEDERRDLIARQHRALYGNESANFFENGAFGGDANTPRAAAAANAASQAAGAAGARGSSPLAFDPFGSQNPAAAAAAAHASKDAVPTPQVAGGAGPSPVQVQQRSRANSNSSPSSNPNSFSLFESAAQQSSRTSNSSPGGSPPAQAGKAPGASAGVAPIGTRPVHASQGPVVNPALNKRSTTPLPSPLSYGFSQNDRANERSTSSASNPAGASDVGLGWGSKSGGVWGTKNPLGVQASVWG